MTKIKICGVYRAEDTEYINRYRPDYFGMIINFEKSHRSVGFDMARRLRSFVDKDIPAVGVFVNEDASVIEKLLTEGTIDIAQLHGEEDEAAIISLQKRTHKPVWKAFKIRNGVDMEAAKKSPADLILLDNGKGTGQRFDWSLIQNVGRPFALAGGLGIDNIEEAIKAVNPYLIDISSGVETNKIKDGGKIEAAVNAVRRKNT